MSLPPAAAERIRAVWARLDAVTDPELDRSVTEMGFVTTVDVDEHACVHITFRLPTYWCAANFAFMMADDMRGAVAALPWVKGVTVVLGEHMYADAINNGIARGHSFREAFADEATDDLDEVRTTFLRKAFQGRQHALLSYLLGAGHDRQALVDLTVSGLLTLELVAEGQKLRDRYLERREVVMPAGAQARAFPTVEGEALSVEGFDAYMRGLRQVCVNAEFNGALCRGLLAARFEAVTPQVGAPRDPLAVGPALASPKDHRG